MRNFQKVKTKSQQKNLAIISCLFVFETIIIPFTIFDFFFPIRSHALRAKTAVQLAV